MEIESLAIGVPTGLVRIATMVYESGKKKDAYLKFAEVTHSYQELIREKVKIGPTGLGAAAKSAFYQVEPKYDEYEAIKIELPQKKMAAAIKTKLLMTKALAKDYTSVVEYKHGDWAVASLYQMGKLSEQFVTAVKDAPIPPEVKTDEQKQLYLLDLSDAFQPVEDAAVQFYSKCLTTSYDYKIYSDYTRKSMDGLERVRPSEFAKDPEFRLAAGTNTATFESSPIIEVK